MKSVFFVSILIAFCLPAYANNTATNSNASFFKQCMDTHHNESICLGYALGIADALTSLECSMPGLNLHRIKDLMSKDNSPHSQLIKSFAFDNVKRETKNCPLPANVLQPLPQSTPTLNNIAPSSVVDVTTEEIEI